MKRSPILRLVTFAGRRPWATTLASLALVAVALVFTVQHFAMTTDTAQLISPKVQWRQDEATLTRAFPQQSDLTVAVVDAATPELAESATGALSGRLAARKDAFSDVRRPEGGPFFAREGLLLLPLRDVNATAERLIAAQPFLGPLAADPSLRGVMSSLTTMSQAVGEGQASLADIDKPVAAMAESLDKVAAGKPAYFSWQSLVGGDGPGAGTRKFILIAPKLDYGALTPGAAASDIIRDTARQLKLDPAHGVTVRLTGSVPLSDEEFASLSDNAGLMSTVMVMAVLAMLWLATRSVKMLLAILVTTFAGLVLTAALGLVTVGRFNLISVAFIPLFVGLGVDFGIQFSVRFRQERLSEPDIVQALAKAASGIGAALVLAAINIAIGFFAFLPTKYVGVSELGMIAGVGMVVALLLNVTLLPALLVLLKPKNQGLEVGWAAMAPVDRFLIHRRKLVLWAFVVSALASILVLPLVRFDFNPFHLRNPHGEAMATLSDLMRDPNQNPNTVDVLAPDAAHAEMLARRLSALPEVAQAVTLSSFVPGDQAAKLAVLQDAQMLLDPTLNPFEVQPAPTDAQNVAALHNAAEALTAAAASQSGAYAVHARQLAGVLTRLASGPPGARSRAQATLVQPLNVLLDQIRAMLSAEPVTLATLPPELVHDWVGVGGQVRVQVFPRGDANDNANLKRFAAAVRKVARHASGAPISIQEAGKTISWAFIQAGVLSLVVISLLLLAVLRSLREVAFTLAPIVLAGFLTLGTCVLIGQPINFANIIAFPLLFGVGVAFHIYFVMAWRAGTRDLLQTSLARAVLFSALTTGMAFGALIFANHPGTASMGKILMISLIWTLVCALVFEPALLGPTPEKSPSPLMGEGLG